MSVASLCIPESTYGRHEITDALKNGMLNGMIVDHQRVVPGDRVKIALHGQLTTGAGRVKIKTTRLGTPPKIISREPTLERFFGLTIKIITVEMPADSLIIEILHAGHQQSCRIITCSREPIQLEPPLHGSHTCTRSSAVA